MDVKEKSTLRDQRKEGQNKAVTTSDLGMYSYQLVVFPNETFNGLVSIECVPHEWLDYNEDTKKCVTKYMPPPYTKIKPALLNKMIKEKDDPDEDWPTYEIEIRGQAETYSLALEKLKVLRQEEYAFTTEPDTSKAETSQRLYKMIEQNRVKRGGEDTSVQVPDIGSSSEGETEFRVDFNNSPIGSDKFDEMSSDENQNLTTASTRNTEGVAHRGETHRARSIFRDQNKTTPRKRSDKKTSNQENVPPKYRDRSRKLSSSKSLNSAAAMEPDTDEFDEMSSKKNQNTSSASNRNTSGVVDRGDTCSARSTVREENKTTPNKRSDKKITNRDNVSSGYHKQSRQPTSSKSLKVAGLAKSIPVLEETTKSKSYSSRDRIEKEKEKSIKSVTAEPQNRHDQLSSTQDIEKWKNDYKSIRYDVNKIKNDVSAIKDLLTQALENVPGLTHLTFHDKYPLDIPFKTMAAFQDFDTELKNDKELRKEFIQSLQMAINSSESLSEIIVNILKKWLSKDVAIQFTAVKVIGDKIVMKDRQFCKCLLKAFDIKMAADPKLAVLSEKDFYNKLGAVLGNARDWEGRRMERSQNKRNTDAT